jgi:integrase
VKNSRRMPWVSIMIVANHLDPAAIKAGVNLKPGQRFGFHNLRHSLSSLLITGQKSDVRNTQHILRHSNSATTIELYVQSPMAQRIAVAMIAIPRKPRRFELCKSFIISPHWERCVPGNSKALLRM